MLVCPATPGTNVVVAMKCMSKIVASPCCVFLCCSPSAPRAREGYYRFDGGIEACIARGIAFAPYADLIWMETKKPILSDAKHFSEEIRKKYPSQLFAYNLSPSFNWDEAGMTDPAIKQLNTELGKLGYVWQFITRT
jgi:isocitrate lyase